MAAVTALDERLNGAANFSLYQAVNSVSTTCLTSGFAEFDLQLPGGGWPAGTLTEIYVDRPGIGELQLAIPVAARQTREARWLAMVNPPYAPDMPALAASGIQLQNVLLLNPPTPDEQAWTCEQLLNNGNCGVLLVWQDHLQDKTLRRLKLAAERHDSIVMLYRSRRAQPFSTATLRLHVGRCDGLTVINVLKRNDGRESQPVKLDLQRSATRRPAIKLPRLDSRLPFLPTTRSPEITHLRPAA